MADIVGFITFLAAGDAGFVTGVVLPIDWGLRTSSGHPPHR
ncbi:MAG: hypothetical protein ABIQ59_16145 [Nocardioidaceae bacterium]